MTKDELRRRLLSWYDKNHRSLPWRSEPGAEPADPYRVLVSEIMLQQTRVDTVVPRFLGFLKEFPSVEILASADSERVRAQWSGLGYYQRAERLHQAAQAVVELGRFPCTAEKLRALPGVGEYTSAAVASIAFGEPVPVLDGNVERVLTRFLAQEGNPKHRKVRRTLHQEASLLVDPERPGDSNQALMELGATVCRKGTPSCAHCPLQSRCLGFQQGRAVDYPSAQPKQPRRRRQWFQRIQLRGKIEPERDDRELLLVQRSEAIAILAGAWLPPDVRQPENPNQSKSDQEKIDNKHAEARLGSFLHSITTTDYEVILLGTQGGEEVRETPHVLQEGVPPNVRWVALSDFDDAGRWCGAEPLPTSSMLSKAIRVLRGPAGLAKSLEPRD